MKKILKGIVKNEIKTPEGKVNFSFGVLLIIGFGIIEVSSSFKECIWRFLFHTEPTNNSFKLLVGILVYLILCVLIILWADIYRKNNLLDGE